MGNLLYVIVVLLFIGWLLGYFVFHLGGLIHLLIVIAAIVLLVRIIRGEKLI
jgi:hypothetical protein